MNASIVTPCAFCRIVSGDAAARVVLEHDHVLGFLDKRPLFPGHVLLVPRLHVGELDDLPTELVEPLFIQAQLLSAAVREALGSQGTFVALNNRVSQSVPHLHVHIVPRTKGDGLRGFFWPRNNYRDDAHADDVAERIRRALRKGDLG